MLLVELGIHRHKLCRQTALFELWLEATQNGFEHADAPGIPKRLVSRILGSICQGMIRLTQCDMEWGPTPLKSFELVG